MTNDFQNASLQKTNQPAFIAYHVNEDSNYWQKIGSAWFHKDSLGFTLDLQLFPTSTGRIVLRRNKALDNNYQFEENKADITEKEMRAI
jgi:hypothetical protein